MPRDRPDAAGCRVRGWCPGALRPMQSGDGLIVRLQADRRHCRCRDWQSGSPAGRANGATVRSTCPAEAICNCAASPSGTCPTLHDALAEAGLLDGSAAGEAVRNVVSSPLAGLDPAAVLDIRPIAKSLEQRLATDPRCTACLHKFGFAVDDGGLLGLAGVPADVRFVACPNGR